MFNVDGRTFDDIDETMYEDLKNFITYVGKQKLNKRKLVKKSKENSSTHIINEKPLHDYLDELLKDTFFKMVDEILKSTIISK